MKREPPSDVIATRKLFLAGEPDKLIVVEIGRPEPFPNGKDYICRWRIAGCGYENCFYAAGVDTLQAFQLALQGIGAELHHIVNEEFGGCLRWLSEDNADFGFPQLP